MKRLIKSISILLSLMLLMQMTACKETATSSVRYTCPMPSDSFFSDKPGNCPKCGMELIIDSSYHPGVVVEKKRPATYQYACPMHPQIQSNTQDNCSICGMKLEPIRTGESAGTVSLNTLIKPSNKEVIANVPMVHISARTEDIKMESFGEVDYDPRQAGVVSSNFSGRIEKLYVKYRFQEIRKGQRLMDIYSPELLTAEQNLLFLLKSDPGNEVLINASKQKLRLLGMSSAQLDKVIKTGKPSYVVSLYSNYSGHIHESSMSAAPTGNQYLMNDLPVTTAALSLKEGMYVNKGQRLFDVYNPDKAWILLNVFEDQATFIKKGNEVTVVAESKPDAIIHGTIDYIEPVYRAGTRTTTARIYFNNSTYNIPIGSQVKATIYAGTRSANWLPEEAVLNLGLDKVVFVRTGESFNARKIETGIAHKHLIQVLGGLDANEAVAANAQYLVDSESFIKTD